MNSQACPKCNSKVSRPSHWKTRTEKQTNKGLHPFRCTTCGHRFLSPRRSLAVRVTWAVVAVAGAAFLVISFMMTSGDFGGLPKTSLPEPVQIRELHQPITADIQTAAERGDIDAQYRIGRSKLMEAAFDAVKGTEAVHWLTQAAEGGHSGAMTRLGLMYLRGTGVLQNYDLAVSWISRSAHKGDPDGMLEYGRLYRDGIGVDKDLIQSYVWLNRSSAANNMAAMREREAIAVVLSKDELRLAQRLSMSAAIDETSTVTADPATPDDEVTEAPSATNTTE